ncbi:MAG: HEAT repeat domain-containing protein [Candidatus Omnitrophota bacterium]
MLNIANTVITAAVEKKNLLAAASGSRKSVANACRELARVATKEDVAPLAAMLGDADQSHMARYAMETIPDPSVDDAFRDALGKLKGLPLVGVIGSIGVRRDTKAIAALTQLLANDDAVVAQAAARALGKIGTVDSGEAIIAALDKTPKANQLAFCEGLFRCAEALTAQGLCKEALAIYDRLRAVKEPHQVRAGALRGAVLLRREESLPLLLEAIRGDDYILTAAAARAAQELQIASVIKAIAGELGSLSADKQTLLKQALGL